MPLGLGTQCTESSSFEFKRANWKGAFFYCSRSRDSLVTRRLPDLHRRHQHHLAHTVYLPHGNKNDIGYPTKSSGRNRFLGKTARKPGWRARGVRLWATPEGRCTRIAAILARDPSRVVYDPLYFTLSLHAANAQTTVSGPRCRGWDRSSDRRRPPPSCFGRCSSRTCRVVYKGGSGKV